MAIEKIEINTKTIAEALSKQKREQEKFFGKDVLKNAIKLRGESYIKAAFLIVENSKTLSPLEKERILDNLNLIRTNWALETENLDKKNLNRLLKTLCVAVQPCFPEVDIETILNNLNNAENHVNWQIERKPIKTIIQLDENTIQVRTDTPITEFTIAQEKEWLTILNQPPETRPDWFKKLHPWEQNYFTNIVVKWHRMNREQYINLGTLMGVPPTTIRGYPGARNCYQSDIYSYTRNPANGKLEQISHISKIRSGHISPSKMKNKKERQKAAQDNLEQLILIGILEDLTENSAKSNFLIDLQTLISPPFNSDDRKMDSDRMEAIKNLREKYATESGKKEVIDFLKTNLKNKENISDNLSITLITSNHPVNKVRTLSNFFKKPSVRKENKKTLKALKRRAKNLEKRESTGTKLTLNEEMAIEALRKMRAISGARNRTRNFFKRGINHNAERAALEQIAVSGLGGIRIGSCMSGKDREGAVTQHVAAMTAFYAKYNMFPPIPPTSKIDQLYLPQWFTNQNLRKEYEEMVAKEFLSCHDHNIAEESARGARGMKDAAVILGKNVRKRIIALYPGEMDKKLGHKLAGLNRPVASDVKKAEPLLTFQYDQDKTKPKAAPTTSNKKYSHKPWEEKP